MNFRENGQLVSGIEIDDMGHKTVGNDLDNAWIHFDNVELPADAMLSRYANVVDDEYKLFNDKLRPFDMIGQRLYTGRVAVAQGALEYRRQLFKRTKEYSDDKICPGNVTLSSIPQLSSLYSGSACLTETVDDMGHKTVGNDLDNAWIHFDNVELPADAMLSRYANVVDDEYKLFNDKLRPFDMIGQRLYTGRVAVAQGALEYRRQLFKRTKEYSDDKICPGNVTLSSIPQLSSLYEENLAQLKMLDELTSKTEKALTECLLENEPPSADLVDAIATCKIMCVEESIAMCHRLKQEVSERSGAERGGV